MYAMGSYFVEVLAAHVPGDGWTADARFSRRDDYRRHIRSVPKVVYVTHITRDSKPAIERAVAQWARDFVTSSSLTLESSLAMNEEIARVDVAAHPRNPAV